MPVVCDFWAILYAADGLSNSNNFTYPDGFIVYKSNNRINTDIKILLHVRGSLDSITLALLQQWHSTTLWRFLRYRTMLDDFGMIGVKTM
jgi:hypothetical protein